jgi:formylglycine-generating enzyme required for sulfatase activity
VTSSLGGGVFAIVPGEAKPAPGPSSPPPGSPAAQAWAVAKDSTSIAALEAFRRQYGSGDAFYDELAKDRIEALRKQQVAVASPPPKVAPPASGVTADTALTPGQVFRDCPDVCPEIVVVPAGNFTMGSPPGEVGRGAEEGPQHKVTIARPFAVGRFEVTFAEWDACVAAGGCRHRPKDGGWGRDRRPAINVSWGDITKEYLPWLSRKTGKSYRLLTEAEWEYAARAGTTTPYSTGRTITTQQANFRGKGVYRAKTVEVGSFQPNLFGLHDVHGNVMEWVQDCWNGNYKGAPSDGSAWTTGDCGRRVLRSASWNGNLWDIRSTGRFRATPVDRDNSSGFRVGRMS